MNVGEGQGKNPPNKPANEGAEWKTRVNAGSYVIALVTLLELLEKVFLAYQTKSQDCKQTTRSRKWLTGEANCMTFHGMGENC